VAFDEASHPRGETGSAQGGKFVAASSSSSSRKTPLKKSGGTLGYNGKTGTGYGSPNGDPRVRKLQEALNKLGLKDSKGRPLKVDGKLGPLTTAAVMAAQRRLGQPPTGKVSPALLSQLTKGKADSKAKSGKPASTHKRAHLAAKKRPLKTSAGKKPAVKAKPKPKPRPTPPPAVQRAIVRIPADQRK
jgi:peptidoglycan hydrolase-like protein with peptidoglycan-binding domain